MLKELIINIKMEGSTGEVWVDKFELKEKKK